jgi:hypothetical protein
MAPKRAAGADPACAKKTPQKHHSAHVQFQIMLLACRLKLRRF